MASLPSSVVPAYVAGKEDSAHSEYIVEPVALAAIPNGISNPTPQFSPPVLNSLDRQQLADDNGTPHFHDFCNNSSPLMGSAKDFTQKAAYGGEKVPPPTVQKENRLQIDQISTPDHCCRGVDLEYIEVEIVKNPSIVADQKGCIQPIIAAAKKEEHSQSLHFITTHIDGIFETPIDAEKDQKLKVFAVEDGIPRQGNSTFTQATLNCVSLLFGLGILSSPFAVAKAGWAGAIVALLIAAAYAYTSYLMFRCTQFRSDCYTYQDVAKLTLGRRTRMLITALFYMEITGTLVGYCISVGDNLSYIFPNSRFSLPGLNNRNFMMFVACLCMLPTVWLRDLSALSFTSMWCIASSVLLLIAVMLAATVNHIGFTQHIPLLRIQGVPVAAGLYAFSFGGTSVFPSIAKSMKNPSKFPQVVLLSFCIATASIVGLGIAGAAMFGDHTASQITLSMPIKFISTKIVLWTTVLTPMFKFALQLSPITTALEIHLRRHCKLSPTLQYGMGTLMRSTVLALIAIVAMVLPYFEYIVALIGSSMTIAICMIFPCVFYVKLSWKTLRIRTIVLIFLLAILGILVGLCGTIVSFKGLINRKKAHAS